MLSPPGFISATFRFARTTIKKSLSAQLPLLLSTLEALLHRAHVAPLLLRPAPPAPSSSAQNAACHQRRSGGTQPPKRFRCRRALC